MWLCRTTVSVERKQKVVKKNNNMLKGYYEIFAQWCQKYTAYHRFNDILVAYSAWRHTTLSLHFISYFFCTHLLILCPRLSVLQRVTAQQRSGLFNHLHICTRRWAEDSDSRNGQHGPLLTLLRLVSTGSLVTPGCTLAFWQSACWWVIYAYKFYLIILVM